MQSQCVVSRSSTKVTISQNQIAEVFVNNELLMFAILQFRYGAILPTSFRPELHILLFFFFFSFFFFNDWNHIHHID